MVACTPNWYRAVPNYKSPCNSGMAHFFIVLMYTVLGRYDVAYRYVVPSLILYNLNDSCIHEKPCAWL